METPGWEYSQSWTTPAHRCESAHGFQPVNTLRPPWNRRPVRGEPDRHLDALAAIDLHHERVTQNPEPVVTR